jgi:hypothetical protein
MVVDVVEVVAVVCNGDCLLLNKRLLINKQINEIRK